MSNLQHNVLAGYRTIQAWQQQIIRNAQGLLLPGYNRVSTRFGATAGARAAGPQAPTGGAGSRSAGVGSNDSIAIADTRVVFEQQAIEPSKSPTDLAINGKGFFLLAENLNPGARLFLSRNGEFRYDAQGRLVNAQGLFVVGGGGRLSDPPTPVRDPGGADAGTVRLADLTLGVVGDPSRLAYGAYGPLIYEPTSASGPVMGFASGRSEVGFAQGGALEHDWTAIGQRSAELSVENMNARAAFKMFKELLDNYNRMADDAINSVR